MKKLLFLLSVLLAFAPQSYGQNDEALTALVQVLGQNDDPQFQLDVLRGMSEGLKGRRGLKMPQGWDEVAAKLAASPNAEVRELTQSLSLTFGSATAMAALRKTLTDPAAPPAARRNALESLVQARDATLPATLQQLLADPAMRAAAIRGLAAYDDSKTADAILKVYPSLNQTEKKDALNTLVSRTSYAKALLASVDQKTIPARDLSADIVRQLRNFKDAEINKQVEKLWGVARDTAADKLKEIAKYKSMIQIEPAGDPFRGRAVFARTCQQCHMLFGEGGPVSTPLGDHAHFIPRQPAIVVPVVGVEGARIAAPFAASDHAVVVRIHSPEPHTVAVAVTRENAALLIRALAVRAKTDARPRNRPIAELLAVFLRVHNLVDQRLWAAPCHQVDRIPLPFRIGATVQQMPVDVDDHVLASLIAESLEMLRRLGNFANDLSNGRAIVQAIDPHRGAGISRPLEHLAIHLFYDLPRIRRARLLRNRERWDDGKRADE
jgi:hypothetical protein